MSGNPYIDLETSIFDNSKIKYIEGLPERDTIIIIWLKIVALSIKCDADGKLLLTKTIPFDEEMLANEFNRPLRSVEAALENLKLLDMIKYKEGIYEIKIC